MIRSSLSFLLLASLLACSHSAADEAIVRSEAAIVQDDAAPAQAPSRVEDVGDLFGDGAPHVAAITLVSGSADGKSAATLDSIGEVRLWRTVDGSSRPLRVHAQKVTALSVASAGEGADRTWQLALAHADGGAALWRFGASDEGRVVRRLPPTQALESITALPGDRGFLALGVDSKLRWLDSAGAELDAIEIARFPASHVEVGGDGKLLLVAESVDSRGAHLALRRFTLGDGKLIAQGDALTFNSGLSAVRWDVDRGRAWFSEQNDAEHRGQIRVIDFAEVEKEQWISVASSVHPAAQSGLLANGDLVVELNGNGTLAITPEGKVRGIAARVEGGGPVDWSGGTRFHAHGSYLGVEGPGQSSRFLGYRPVASIQAAVDPSGARVAWGMPESIDIEDQAGKVMRVPNLGRARAISELAWLDETTLVVFRSDGAVELLDAKSGELLDAVDSGAPLIDAQIDAAASAVALRTQTWGSRQMLWIEERRFVSQATVLDGGSFYGVLPASENSADSRAGLWSYDGQRLRRYAAQDLHEGIEHARRTELETERPDPNVQLVAALPDGAPLWLGVKVEANQSASHLYRFDERNKSLDIEVGHGNPTWLRMGPEGKRVLVILSDPSGMRVAHLVDLEARGLRWKRRLANDALVEWSAGGETVLAQSLSSGVQLWSAGDGETLSSRCAFEFEVLPAPPTVSSSASEYLCE